ncbi:MAG: SapC family protein [Burkholderiaceae bacterium]|nr:SapC family protein [Burkholderiaceae bacterium]
MPNFQVINKTAHATRRWLRNANYSFTANERMAALVAAELPKAMMGMPIGFVAQGEGFVPVVLLSLIEERNLFVAQDGRWLGTYVPAAYRAHPFRLARTPEGKDVLCIDEGSIAPEGGADGQPFFDDDGEPAKTVLEVLDLLTKTEQNRVATEAACALLQRHGLLQPWPVSVQTEAGARQIGGLFQVNEEALNAVPAEALAELRSGGALMIAYSQMLSMQHLQKLGALAEGHAKVAAQAKAAQERLAPARELDLEFLNNGGTISFGNLG